MKCTSRTWIIRSAIATSFIALASCSTLPTTASYPVDPVSAVTIEQDMAFLASDELEGRLTGTEGYDKAADYVAKRFADYGLKPGGSEGYFQPITFSQGSRQADETQLIATLENGTILDLIKDEDFYVNGSAGRAEASEMGEAVFVGFGLVAPEQGRNDYDGLDVDGKIVVALSGTPSYRESEERAYYGNQKGLEAAKRGAIGFVTLETPARNKRRSFEKIVASKSPDRVRMTWMYPDGSPYFSAPNLKVGAYVSLQGGRKMIEAAGGDFDAIMAASEEPEGLIKGFDLGLTMSLSQKSKIETVTSSNVIGILEGSDPVLKDEYIVLTAHLDHLGVLPAEDGTMEIHNGALDNAAGVSALIDVARKLSDEQTLSRSVMFLIVTAEEKGLLGAQYFTLNPTVPKEAMVGNVNLDMPVLIYDFQDVVAFGGSRSTMSDALDNAAEAMGLVQSPDPFPGQGIFTRSDHYRFVELGIPSIFLATGFMNGGEEAWGKMFAEHYHQPSDEMDLPINFDAAARFSEINLRITRELANARQKPLWRKDDFFARQFGGEMED